MRHTTSLFINDMELTLPYNEKIKEMQKTGKVPSEYDGEIDGKKVKIWLPQDVREQYKSVLMAESFLLAQFNTDTDNLLTMRFALWDLAKKYSLVDGKEGCKMSDNDFSVEFIEQMITLYVSELLLPLYHRSSTRVKDLMRNNLKGFIKESPKE